MVTAYYDFALISVWLFFIFFALLLVYLRREDKREGYPLDSDRSDRVTVQGWPAAPPPKFYRHAHAAVGPVKLAGADGPAAPATPPPGRDTRPPLPEEDR